MRPRHRRSNFNRRVDASEHLVPEIDLALRRKKLIRSVERYRSKQRVPVRGLRRNPAKPPQRLTNLSLVAFAIQRPEQDRSAQNKYGSGEEPESFSVPKVHSKLPLIPNGFDCLFAYCDNVQKLAHMLQEEALEKRGLFPD